MGRGLGDFGVATREGRQTADLPGSPCCRQLACFLTTLSRRLRVRPCIGSDAREQGKGHGKSSGLGDHEQYLFTRFETTTIQRLFKHDEDTGGSRVSLGV